LDAVQDYIAERNPAAAFKLATAILDLTGRLSETPEMG
jgi:plasmid stabilization system protein ParE